MSVYEESLAAEKKIYENCVEVHHLPPIFHYWSNRHLLPMLQPFGFSSPAGMFEKYIRGAGPRPARILSLGSGNCDLEIDLALALGVDYHFDCVDLNPTMLERGRQAALTAGVSSQLNCIGADLNTWSAGALYDVILANQSLHHVVNLEGLFEQIGQSLRPGGRFLISDMIGRNGHQRWPEALDVIHQFWRKLPPSYRFNQLVGYFEELYESWDCSVQGFEGVRSQDILPLLIDRFHFHLFVGYGNAIDPFIDRAFGGHFNISDAWDREFIDQVHRRDQMELASGRLKPTHMMAVVANEPCADFSGNFAPESCIRRPLPTPLRRELDPYDWTAWPHDRQKELEIACSRLASTGREIKDRTAWAQSLAQQLEQRTAWALSLKEDVQARDACCRRLEQEFEDRTTWALRLQLELEQSTLLTLDLRRQIDELDQEITKRTQWALCLQQQLSEHVARAERAETELYNLTHKPLYFLKRLLQRLAKFIM